MGKYHQEQGICKLNYAVMRLSLPSLQRDGSFIVLFVRMSAEGAVNLGA